MGPHKGRSPSHCAAQFADEASAVRSAAGLARKLSVGGDFALNLIGGMEPAEAVERTAATAVGGELGGAAGAGRHFCRPSPSREFGASGRLTLTLHRPAIWPRSSQNAASRTEHRGLSEMERTVLDATRLFLFVLTRLCWAGHSNDHQGSAALTAPRVAQIRSQLPPGYRNVPVNEVRP